MLQLTSQADVSVSDRLSPSSLPRSGGHARLLACHRRSHCWISRLSWNRLPYQIRLIGRLSAVAVVRLVLSLRDVGVTV